MTYLLDSNAISSLVGDPRGRIAERIAAVGERYVITSAIVSAEVAFGVRKKGSQELAKKVAGILQHLFIAPFAPPADQCYAEVRSELERRGQPIGPNDLLIAAHAIALQATLVTDNVREFSRVSRLQVENWLRD